MCGRDSDNVMDEYLSISSSYIPDDAFLAAVDRSS
jgi:hypothetical protein